MNVLLNVSLPWFARANQLTGETKTYPATTRAVATMAGNADNFDSAITINTSHVVIYEGNFTEGPESGRISLVLQNSRV